MGGTHCQTACIPRPRAVPHRSQAGPGLGASDVGPGKSHYFIPLDNPCAANETGSAPSSDYVWRLANHVHLIYSPSVLPHSGTTIVRSLSVGALTRSPTGGVQLLPFAQWAQWETPVAGIPERALSSTRPQGRSAASRPFPAVGLQEGRTKSMDSGCRRATSCSTHTSRQLQLVAVPRYDPFCFGAVTLGLNSTGHVLVFCGCTIIFLPSVISCW
ncbi:hypothetical protein B0H19DRAFT_1088472 [Mycena capillaripes]|nr:hypothetical protein B0H19DRAFT_1088472 [Mycena capillaripes]